MKKAFMSISLLVISLSMLMADKRKADILLVNI